MNNIFNNNNNMC